VSWSDQEKREGDRVLYLVTNCSVQSGTVADVRSGTARSVLFLCRSALRKSEKEMKTRNRK
jgi:hypothetical protein